MGNIFACGKPHNRTKHVVRLLHAVYLDSGDNSPPLLRWVTDTMVVYRADRVFPETTTLLEVDVDPDRLKGRFLDTASVVSLGGRYLPTVISVDISMLNLEDHLDRIVSTWDNRPLKI